MGSHLGSRLRRVRLEQGLTQGTIAGKLKVSQVTICNWEKGKGAPDERELRLLEKVLGKFNVPVHRSPNDSEASRDSDSPANESRIFGDWLRKTREAADMSRYELAEESGVSHVQIYNLEVGRSTNPRDVTRRRLEKALKAKVPEEIQDEVADEQAIEGLGHLIDFDPYKLEDCPACAGVYVFYDVSDRPVYVGKAEVIKKRVSDHVDKFWFKYPIVSHAAYVEIKGTILRHQVEQVLIKFLKSNAVINKQSVDRE
jgi:transcriptional regulator with XRE-family HTH domain